MRFECKAEDLKNIVGRLTDINKVDGVLIASWQLVNDPEEDAMLNLAYNGQYQIRFTLSNTDRNDLVTMSVKGITQDTTKSTVSVPFDVFIDLVSKVKEGNLILDITDEKIKIYGKIIKE